MKRLIAIMLAVLLAAAAFAGCSGKTGGAVKDGRARPSNSGALKVVDGKLCSSSGEKVMLRGISTNDLICADSYVNEALFKELSKEYGVNVIRLAMYTYGMGVLGYCTKGDRARYKADIDKAVQYAAASDMYVIIDWHILSDGDPNTHIDDAAEFFAEMAEKYRGNENVIYEICNEPNGVDWQAVKSYAETVIPVIREKAPESLILVGNPDWSKDLRSVAADPLDFENVMYTLHFYSATHGADIRSMAEEASQSGLPIFVTEYGVTASSGDLPRDIPAADEWIDMLERENISYCMWSLARTSEASSVILPRVSKTSGFDREDFTETGKWFLDNLEKHQGM